MLGGCPIHASSAALADVHAFAQLDPAAVDELGRSAQLKRFTKGTNLFVQGEKAQAVYAVLSGSVRVSQLVDTGAQNILRLLGPGEIVGCVFICGENLCPATASAATSLLALAWEVAPLRRLVARHPQIAVAAVSTLSQRLQEIVARNCELSTERADRRVAHTLLRLCQQVGRPVAGGTEIAVPLSRQDVAELSGASLFTVSRLLSAWTTQGMIGGGRCRIVVQDRDALQEIGAQAP